jgi:hypothetical protein
MIAAAAVGALLGLSMRVPVVAVASAAILLAGVAIAPFADAGALTVALTTFGSLVALQCGYLAGVTLSCAWSRARISMPSARQITLGWIEGRPSSRIG